MSPGADRRLPAERTLRTVAAALAVVGIGVATYIAIADASSGSPVCLAGGHGCETVAQSHYSHLLGVNVAVIGIAGYLLLLASALVGGDAGRFAGLLLAAIGFGFSAYLTYLELFVIDAICQWCVASAVLMTALVAVNAARAFGYAGAELAGAEAAAGEAADG
jgi:uncharacterized membrane protein